MRTVITSRSVIEQMAFDHPSAVIEITSEAAFLTVGGTTWYALLEQEVCS